MKSDEASESFRGEGNEFYKVRKFHDALVLYNKSLCHATADSNNLGLAFGNKSAVYLEMKLIGKCLRNINLAIDHKYPSENIEILRKRREKCLAMVKQEMKVPNPFDFFKKSYKKNRQIPFIVDCLELKVNEKYGKHIITNKDLRVGDVIAVEKPFCSVLLSQSSFVEVDSLNKYQRCTSCLRDNQLDLIPCETCCDAMFCSLECQAEADKKFHRLECPVMSMLLQSGSVHIALRIFFTFLSAFDGSIEKLEEFAMENEKLNSTIFDFDVTVHTDNENVKNYLKCFSSLNRSSKIFSLQPYEVILSSHPELKAVWSLHEKFIKNFIQQICQTNDLYFHGIFSGNSKQSTTTDPLTAFKDLQKPTGTGFFVFCSLINHSCSPNVIRIYTEGSVALVVCRPIQKDSQLFDCYKATFSSKPKAERQTQLLKEFHFTCDCEACVNNFPCPPNLTFKDVKLLKFAKKIEDDIFQLKGGCQAVKRFRDCCEAMETNNQTFPCLEMSFLLKSFAMFLLIKAAPFSIP